jgi:hydrogenase maturation protease
VRNILIGGIGNVLLGDDGVGPYVARLLNAGYEFEPGVEVLDLGTPALDLIDELSGREAVILIDSVHAGAAAGAVTLYQKEDIVRHRPEVRMDPHSPALVETLLSAELFGVAPGEVLLIGVQGADFAAGCELSEDVSRAIPLAIVAVLGELTRLGVEYRERERAQESAIWWTRSGKLQAANA